MTLFLGDRLHFFNTKKLSVVRLTCLNLVKRIAAYCSKPSPAVLKASTVQYFLQCGIFPRPFYSKLKKNVLISTALCFIAVSSFSQDSKFYVFLCFGQSNMEGYARPEAQDSIVDTR